MKPWLTRHFTLLFSATFMLAGCGGDSDSRAHATKLASAVTDEPVKVTTARVQLRNVTKDLKIPSELVPFREVAIYPKVQGFVKTIAVDRGSSVHQGQLLVLLQAPEIDAQCGEAQGRVEAAQAGIAQAAAKVQSLLSETQEARSKLLAEEALQRRIQVVAKTPGAVAPYDLEQAEQKVAAAKARLDSANQNVSAAQAELASVKGKLKSAQQSLASVQQLKTYLSIPAPFNGVITERNVHEGSLVNSGSANAPMLRISQVSKLRLVVPIPEHAVSHVKLGDVVTFTVPAHEAKLFRGTIERISHNVDTKTRTMIVEADVENASGQLEPGMYPEVALHLHVETPNMVVPATAVKEHDGKCYVMKIVHGKAEEVDVTCKETIENFVVVIGQLEPDDEVATSSLNQLHARTKI